MKTVNEAVKKKYGNYPEKVLQFGEGNFLRAFVDWMIDKANRDGKNFECRCCGHKDDADHNASINIKERIDDKEALGICDTYRHSQKQKHRHLKELYAGRNKAWRESQAQQNPSGSTAVLPSGAMAI